MHSFIRHCFSASVLALAALSFNAGSNGAARAADAPSAAGPASQFTSKSILLSADELAANQGSGIAPRAAGLTIIPTFDVSITSNPRSADIQTTINSAIKAYSDNFTDPITVNLTFINDPTVGLGQSQTFIGTFSYTAVRAALASHSTTADDVLSLATLPNQANNPVNNSPSMILTTAQGRTLGFNSNPPAGSPDSTISLNTSLMNILDSDNVSTQYSMFSTVCHEINEVLGSGSVLNNLKNGDPAPTGAVRVPDLFRYSSTAGTRSFTTDAAALACFSINGVTPLVRYSQNQNGDFADWYSPGGQTPRVQDAFATPGAKPVLAEALRVLDAIGYSRVFSVLNLAVTVVGTPAIVTAGSGPSNLSYLVTVTNSGPSPSRGLQLSNTLVMPTGVTLANGFPSGTTTFDPTTYIWTVGTLAVGASATLNLTLTVGPDASVGTNVISETATVTSIAAAAANPAKGTATATSSVTFSLASGISASPPLPVVGQLVTFSAAVAGQGVAFAWDFGDGSTGSGPVVTHAYAAPGTYLVTLSVTDGHSSQTAALFIPVIIYPAAVPIIGTGKDTDGDGFSDSFEIANGSDPKNPHSTPFGGAPAQNPGVLNVAQRAIKLNFSKDGGDSIMFNGTVNVPPSYVPDGKVAYVVVGNVLSSFALDSRGFSKQNSNSFKISMRNNRFSDQLQTLKFNVSLVNGSFAQRLSDAGLINADAGGAVSVPFAMYFNGNLLLQTLNLNYKAKKNKSGSAK